MEFSKKVKKTVGFSNIEKILKSKGNKKNDTYKGIKELKEDLKENEKLKKKFENVKSQKEAIKIAQKLGYKISEKEIENDEELEENMLESISGGRTKVKVRNYSFSSNTIAEGDNSDVKTNVTWDAREERKS